MFSTVRNFDDFYKTREGRLVRRVLRQAVSEYTNFSLNSVGVGYSSPYIGGALSVFPVSLKIMGDDGKKLNNVACSDLSSLPLESSSLDIVIFTHGLERCEYPIDVLKEISRVLKSEGRLIMLVPNRRGLWAHCEWSPFGHGRPFSAAQLKFLLSEVSFVCDEVKSVLFTPPLKWRIMLRLSSFFEKYCPYVFPTMGGVNIAVARKQTYAPIKPSKGTAVPVRSILRPLATKSTYTGKE
ncbi:MAG: methyltransferase domain-containing protein [Alphaproteobacteria bacterium]|nr:methyltransferase domain-containing protein [Alphaproteobacteria bacterium]